MLVSDKTRKQEAQAFVQHILDKGIYDADVLAQLPFFKVEAWKQLPVLEPPITRPALGIWVPETIEGKTYFVRDKSRYKEWIKWADLNKIPPKSDKKRILLLGESVARGSFYGNQSTPAQVLEHVLNQQGSMGTVEVIDLSKVGMELNGLTELLEAATQLEPDEVVIFAGNNFFYQLYHDSSISQLREWASAYLEEGFSGVKEKINALLARHTRNFLQHFQKVLGERGTELYFVIPEFNFGDWHASENETVVPNLTPVDQARWASLKERAHIAIREADWDSLQGISLEMIELESTHPLGYEYAGQACLQTNKKEEARHWLTQARDNSLLFRSVGKPRILSVVRQTLLNYAPQFQIQVVDLPAVFRNFLEEGLPGRELFMDYCHMHIQGIQLAMAALAEKMLGTTPAQTVPQLMEWAAELTPDPKVQAMAHIYAAIHNAHYGQSAEIIRYHCEQGATLDPVAQDFMKRYIELASYKAANPLCESFGILVMEPDFGIDKYPEAIVHPENEKLLDDLLVDTMVDVLEKVGIDTREKVAQLRQQEHGIGFQSTNLLEPCYASQSYDASLAKDSYFKVRDTSSTFRFVTDQAHDLSLQITYRTPHSQPTTNPVAWLLNGVEMGQLPASAWWQSEQLQLPVANLKNGINTITLIWPHQARQALPQIQHIDSLNRFISLLTPDYGEIFEFKAKKITARS